MPWKNTIPSNFVKLALEKNVCIFAKNFGVPTHHSLQETIYFSSVLAKSEIDKPDLVIFLDGLNDFASPKSTIKQQPHLTPVVKSIFDKQENNNNNPFNFPLMINFRFNLTIVDYVSSKLLKNPYFNLNRENYKLPENYSEKKAAFEIANKINNNNLYTSKICESYKISCFQFIQPVAIINYFPYKGETITQRHWANNKSMQDRYKIGYLELKKLIKHDFYDFLKTTDISNIFHNYKNGIPYVDPGHYSPRASKEIAQKMLDIIKIK